MFSSTKAQPHANTVSVRIWAIDSVFSYKSNITLIISCYHISETILCTMTLDISNGKLIFLYHVKLKTS